MASAITEAISISTAIKTCDNRRVWRVAAPTVWPDSMDVSVVDGDLLDQNVDVIVNAWNRNIIPWWLLLPQGVSGAIKRRGGYSPFRELAHHGAIPLGGAVLTSAGRLPFKGIIHVAGISLLWRSSERSIRSSVRNALNLASEHGFRSIAFPLIGAGTGGKTPAVVLELMLNELSKASFPGEARIVRFRPGVSTTAPVPAAPSQEASHRMCYCDLWEKSPDTLRQQGVPPGYCGLCEKCGMPGHTRHFPGPIPYTGSWCDYHYRMLLILDPRTGTGCLPWIVLTGIVIGLIWWLRAT
jgi:O-acetyl-ADP-ribose deacetylase